MSDKPTFPPSLYNHRPLILAYPHKLGWYTVLYGPGDYGLCDFIVASWNGQSLTMHDPFYSNDAIEIAQHVIRSYRRLGDYDRREGHDFLVV